MKTCKEIVRETVNGNISQPVPYGFDMTTAIKNKLAASLSISKETLSEFYGDHFKYVYPETPEFYINDTHDFVKDIFGVIWNKRNETGEIGDWGGIAYSPLEKPCLDGFIFPEARKTTEFKQDYSSSQYVIMHIDGIFDLAWHIRGFEQLMTDFACEERFVESLLDKCLEYNMEMISMIPDGVDGCRFGEDWGQQKGLLMGSRLWRKFLKPRFKEMYAAAAKKNLQVFIHSCGDIADIFPDLIEIGVQAVNPIQPEVMDVHFLKNEYGKYITLYGGLSCQHTIPSLTVKEVMAEAELIYNSLSKGGRYIFGPSGAIPTDAPIENVLVLLNYVKNGYNNV